MKTRLRINGRDRVVDADSDTPLLWVLRDWLGLTGTKYGCGVGLCGSCTIQLDGEAMRSCTVSLGSVGDREITTIEGLSEHGDHPVQRAWLEGQVPQCGYCQPGMMMAAAALLERNPTPSDADIDRSITNLCRCGTYSRVRSAIHRAASETLGADHSGTDDVDG
jgi:aerobic-type carbon monoxide dehydrogenase small subunit (CoxS/CutS family)